MNDAPSRVGARNAIALRLLSDVKFLGPLRTMVREACGLLNFESSVIEEIVLAVQEGCANVIRHCYGGCNDKRIDMWLVFTDDELTIEIVDYGTFVDPSKIKSRELEDVRPGGLGVHLMQKVMDEVKYEKNEAGGTTLTLRKRVPGSDSGSSSEPSASS